MWEMGQRAVVPDIKEQRGQRVIVDNIRGEQKG